MLSFKAEALGSPEGPFQELADISHRLKHGASVSEVNAAYEASEFPTLKKMESQMAMLKAVERSGLSAVVNQVLIDECTSTSPPNLANIGFKALLTTLANESYRTEEVITNFLPEDFSPQSAKERFAELVHQSREVSTAQVHLPS